MSHTPGPWTVEARSLYETNILAGSKVVATAHAEDVGVELANARLMAAGPDMYRALKTLLDAEPGKDRDIGAEIEQAEAAVAKAEARES